MIRKQNLRYDFVDEIQLLRKKLGDAYKEFSAGQAGVDESFKSLTHALKTSQKKSLRKF